MNQDNEKEQTNNNKKENPKIWKVTQKLKGYLI